MSFTIRPFRTGGWEIDIVLTQPNGEKIRERRKAPVATKADAKRWGQERERHLLQHGRPQPRSGKAKPEEAVLLLHSTLLRGRDGDPQELMSALAADPRFEHLAPENLAQPSKGLRYTTMLKYKGLDKPLVILVLPPLLKWDKKLHHQFLVGASRASVRLCVLAPEKVPA